MGLEPSPSTPASASGGKRRKLAAALCLLGMAFVTVFLWTRNREPQYNGRSLSQWYVFWEESTRAQDAMAKARETEAVDAIRHIGSNAIPVLLKRLRMINSGWYRLECDLVGRLPEPIANSRFVSSFIRGSETVEPTSTFFLLGPLGGPAVPQLTVFLNATNNRDLTHSAAFCLAAICPEGLPPLLKALADPKLPGCCSAACWLGNRPFECGTNLAEAVPLLAKRSADPDSSLAQEAIKALGRIRLMPEVSIPALTNAMRSSHSWIRREAVFSLERFGTQNVPVITSALKDPDISVQNSAKLCLRLLASAGLTNTPAR